MNSLERAYAVHLEHLKAEGEIRGWKFHPVRLRISWVRTKSGQVRTCYYEPDFLVIARSRELEVHEVKGFWRDDALVKIKAASELYPEFAFVAVRRLPKKKGGGWDVEDF